MPISLQTNEKNIINNQHLKVQLMKFIRSEFEHLINLDRVAVISYYCKDSTDLLEVRANFSSDVDDYEIIATFEITENMEGIAIEDTKAYQNYLAVITCIQEELQPNYKNLI